MKNKELYLAWFISLICILLVFPYLMDLPYGFIDFSELPFSRGVFVLIATLQASLFVGLALIAGRWFARRMDYSIFPPVKMNYFIEALILGLSTGLFLLLIDYIFHVNNISPTFFSVDEPVIWKSLLASFYGGMVEEILMRFFLVSMFAWLIVHLAGRRSPRKKKLAGALAIIIVAVIFGLAHLPVMNMLAELNTVLIIRVILLNGAGGIVFGFLYTERGLVYAIISHFVADLVLQVIFPLIYF